MAGRSGSNALPEAVWMKVSTSLDIHTLAACCCVCKDWNNRIPDFAWQNACEFSGLRHQTIPRDRDSWRDYALGIMSRFRQMRRSECFTSDNSFIIGTEKEGVVAIYYYKNQLAVAYKSKVQMWSITNPRKILYQVHSHTPRAQFTSVKFDDSYIVLADSWGRITCIEVSSQIQKSCCEGPNENMTSYDFESDIGIVVGSYMARVIYIWELTTGSLLKHFFTDLSLVIKLKMVLIRKPEIPERGVIYLFAMDLDRLHKWTITFDSYIRKNGIECISEPWNLQLRTTGASRDDYSSTTSFLGYERMLYYPDSPADAMSDKIIKLDLDTMHPSEINPGGSIRNLLAVGKQYIAFRTAEEGVHDKLRVIEKSSNELRVVATYGLPDDIVDNSRLPDNHALVFCDRAWLDCLDTTNDSGVLLAYIRTDGKVYFVNWIPRRERNIRPIP